MVQSAVERACPPVPARRAAREDLLDLPGAERVRARELLREHVRVGRGLDALPDVAAGHLVVAVAGVERRREADVDVRLGHADDPRDPPQRLRAPEELAQRRARVVEEVDAVDVEDVDRAGAVVRDAVLVLAPQAERRADLRAGGVAAALAAGDHDDPALDVVALMPDAARADDARVVVRMGPLAHHVDLHGLVGRVRRRRRPREPHAKSDRRAAARTTPKRLTSSSSSLTLTLAPLRTTSNTRSAVRYSRVSARVKFAPTTLITVRTLVVAATSAALLVAPASASRRARCCASKLTRDSVRYGAAHRITGTLLDGTAPRRRPGGRARGPPVSRTRAPTA